MCYRDRTYCPHQYHQDCIKSDDCSRVPTYEDYDVAERIGLHICQFAEKPHCFEEVKNETH